MNWPQWTMVAIMVFSVVFNAFDIGRNRQYSSERATAYILGYVAYYALFAGLLRAGGFW